MRSVELNNLKKAHNFKIGDLCPDKEPNITEDTLMLENGVPIGFYLAQLPKKLCDIADYCNAELLSDRVPKTLMDRSDVIMNFKKQHRKVGVSQFSTIIGAVPARLIARRSYNSISSVHSIKSAHNFIKAMKLLAHESEKLIEEIMPEQAAIQRQIIANSTLPKYRFGSMFTSSISNYNIAAKFHIDAKNLKNCVNVIIAKRLNAIGGNTYVPDYDACFDSKNNSMLVYPAWKNLHGVTRIIPTSQGGYRNSLVFYPLSGFDREDIYAE